MDDMDGWETSRRIRAAGVKDLPIIMVSANAFENQPQRLSEAGAQAFVDKPVIESELLVALQKHLQLEWLAELPKPGWTAGSGGLAAAADTPLPAEFSATLTRLARIGHAQGLKEALRRLQVLHPSLGAQVGELMAMVERYDFAELLERLSVPLPAGEQELS
jgi:DNA-binding NarL/FixJ family response regulator